MKSTFCILISNCWPYLEFIGYTFMTKTCRVFGCYTIIPSTEDSTNIIEVKCSTAFYIVLLVRFGDAESKIKILHIGILHIWLHVFNLLANLTNIVLTKFHGLLKHSISSLTHLFHPIEEKEVIRNAGLVC